MTPDRERLLTPDTAEFLTGKGFQTSPSTLETLRSRGGGPEYEYFGRRVLYKPAKLVEWAYGRLSMPVNNTSQPTAA
jgi:hypothetical protein